MEFFKGNENSTVRAVDLDKIFLAIVNRLERQDEEITRLKSEIETERRLRLSMQRKR